VSSIQQTVRDDPVGATIAVLLAALIVLLGAAIVLDRMPGQEDWRDYIFRPKVSPHRRQNGAARFVTMTC
jgi:hypothetical protein